MFKLVECLATKTERAKATTIVFAPLGFTFPRMCDWCGECSANPKGWAGYAAIRQDWQRSKVSGHVCANEECRISIQARYCSAD
jgi:hypothetical protein